MSAVAAAARVLEARLGLDPACIGDATLVAAVERRVRSLGLESAARYAALIADDDDETLRLADELLVRESWFFRDRKPFALLARFLAARRGARPLRILSAPCARGEEPYSVAMALLAHGLEFSVDAVDLSRLALDEARRGEFGARAVRSTTDGPEEAWLRRFTTAGAGGRFAVTPAVRACVTFHHASLTALSSVLEPGYDAILCRNALIYLSERARAAVVETCWTLLASGGLLIVGHAEAGPSLERHFRRHAETGAFAFVRRDVPVSRGDASNVRSDAATALRGAATTAPSAGATPRRVTAQPHVTTARSSAVLAGGGTPAAAPRTPHSAAITDLHSEPPTTSALDDARTLADRGAYHDAAALLASHLAGHPADVEAHHLLGVVEAARGDDRAARSALERALYLDPTHTPSLTQLVLLLETAGDAGGAERLRRRLRRTS